MFASLQRQSLRGWWARLDCVTQAEPGAAPPKKQDLANPPNRTQAEQHAEQRASAGVTRCGLGGNSAERPKLQGIRRGL